MESMVTRGATAASRHRAHHVSTMALVLLGVNEHTRVRLGVNEHTRVLLGVVL